MKPEEMVSTSGRVHHGSDRLFQSFPPATVQPWPFLWLPKTGLFVAIAEIVSAKSPNDQRGGEVFVNLKTDSFYAHGDDWPLIQAALGVPQPICRLDPDANPVPGFFTREAAK